MQVVGISFDGDASYLQYVDNMFQHIRKLPRLDLRCPLSGIIKEYVDVLIFEDMFHLVKCCRYRFVCGSDICPSLSSDQETFGLEDFRKIGIKDYILDQAFVICLNFLRELNLEADNKAKEQEVNQFFQFELPFQHSRMKKTTMEDHHPFF